MTPEELRTRRQQLGLSQAGLAAFLSVDQRIISRWETGAAAITAPRSVWLDVEMKRVERERKPKRRHRRPPAAAPGAGSEG